MHVLVGAWFAILLVAVCCAQYIDLLHETIDLAALGEQGPSLLWSSTVDKVRLGFEFANDTRPVGVFLLRYGRAWVALSDRPPLPDDVSVQGPLSTQTLVVVSPVDVARTLVGQHPVIEWVGYLPRHARLDNTLVTWLDINADTDTTFEEQSSVRYVVGEPPALGMWMRVFF